MVPSGELRRARKTWTNM